MGKLIDRKCPACGKIYKADKVRLKHGRQTTCSRKCSYDLRAQGLRNSKELICPVCNRAFYRSPAQIKRVKHASVCSIECLYRGRSLGIIKRTITSPYVYTSKGKAALLESARKPKGKRVHHWLVCGNCGKQFDDPNWGRKRKRGIAFCSLACCNAYRVGENGTTWIGGHPKYYGPNWRPQRRKARQRDKYTCQECGVTEKEIDQELDVHHVIRFGDFESYKEANRLENLISLCHSCHMQREWSDNR